MPQNPKTPTPAQGPKPGDLVIDVTALAGILVDLPEGETRGMLTERDGFEEVIAEILANQAPWGEKAGVTATDIEELQEANDVLAKLAPYLPAARKLVEVLEETYAKYDDRRQRFVYTVANGVERRAKSRDDGGTLLAKYQKTRAYRSELGLKAVKTRRRNAAEGSAGEAAPRSDAQRPTVPYLSRS